MSASVAGRTTVSLAEVATLVRDGVPAAEAAGRRYVALDHIEPGTIRLMRSSTGDGVRSAKFAFKAGDVLYGKLRPYLDKAVLADFDGVASTELLVLRAKDWVDSTYLAFLMHSPPLLDHAKATTGGVNHPRTSWPALGSLEIALPSLDEQRRIARILSTIQRAREARQRVVRTIHGALEANRAALFEASGPMVSLSEVVSDIRYGTSERCIADGVGPPVMGIKNVGEVDLHEQQGASRLPRHPSSGDKGWLRPGDLLFVRTNADLDRIGRCAVFEGVPDSAMFASYLLRARVEDPHLNPRFIAHYAASQAGRDALRAGGSGAADGKFNLNAPTLGSWYIPRPPLAQQLLAVERLDAYHRSLNAHEVCLSRLDLVFRAALTKLMDS